MHVIRAEVWGCVRQDAAGESIVNAMHMHIARMSWMILLVRVLLVLLSSMSLSRLLLLQSLLVLLVLVVCHSMLLAAPALIAIAPAMLYLLWSMALRLLAIHVKDVLYRGRQLR